MSSGPETCWSEFRRSTAAVRTLILLFICSLFVGFAVLDARGRGRDSRRMLVEAALALCVGLAVCYFLVYVVGIFDDWKYSFRN